MSLFNRDESSSSLSNNNDGGYPTDRKGDMSHHHEGSGGNSRSLVDHIPGMHHSNPGQQPVSFPQVNVPQSIPPPYNPEPVASAGDRVALGHSPGEPFPPPSITGPAPFADGDRTSPIFIGSAIFPDGTVHPCKIAPRLSPRCRVPYGGEREHNGRYDLLPFHAERMEWVATASGVVPPGRRPVMGGYELWGGRPTDLYHARGMIDGVLVPGKTGRHLNGANFAYGNQEHAIVNGLRYDILCWR